MMARREYQAKCENPIQHRPTPHYAETHHVIPKAWVRAGAKPGRLVELCGNCHNDTHVLMNFYISYRGRVPQGISRTFSLHTRQLAREAWEKRPSDTPPRTRANGEAWVIPDFEDA